MSDAISASQPSARQPSSPQPFAPASFPKVALVLFAAGLLSRWLTRSQLVQAWDAGNFVLALTDLNLDAHQPHMPGCFWLLIAMGRLMLPLVGGDGVAALELVNALVSAAALPCGWLLAHRLGGERAAWWMAGLLFSAPLLWFYASQPLSYGAELGWVVAIACCAWSVSSGERQLLLPLAVLMATAGGIRPNTPIFLLPVVFICCLRGWRRGLELWRLAAAVALGFGVLVAWGQAFLAEVGGLEVYGPLLMSWRNDHAQQASDHGLFANGWLLLKTIALTAPFGLALVLVRRRRPERDPWRSWFLGLWVLPAALYFLFVHFTRMGHATTLLPALLLSLSLWLSGSGSAAPARIWFRDLLWVVALQSLLFLLVPGDRFASELRSYDHDWQLGIRAARSYDPATTLVITTGRSNLRAYRLPSVHLPAYDHGDADFVLDQRDDFIDVSLPIQRVVVLDRGQAFPAPDGAASQVKELVPGRMRLIELPVPAEGLRVGRRRIHPSPQSPG